MRTNSVELEKGRSRWGVEGEINAFPRVIVRNAGLKPTDGLPHVCISIPRWSSLRALQFLLHFRLLSIPPAPLTKIFATLASCINELSRLWGFPPTPLYLPPHPPLYSSRPFPLIYVPPSPIYMNWSYFSSGTLALFFTNSFSFHNGGFIWIFAIYLLLDRFPILNEDQSQSQWKNLFILLSVLTHMLEPINGYHWWAECPQGHPTILTRCLGLKISNYCP